MFKAFRSAVRAIKCNICLSIYRDLADSKTSQECFCGRPGCQWAEAKVS